MFFKKNSKSIVSDHLMPNVLNKFNTEVTAVPCPALHGGNDSGSGSSGAGREKESADDGHKWKFFETIKIHTDKRHANDTKSVCRNRSVKIY